MVFAVNGRLGKYVDEVVMYLEAKAEGVEGDGWDRDDSDDDCDDCDDYEEWGLKGGGGGGGEGPEIIEWEEGDDEDRLADFEEVSSMGVGVRFTCPSLLFPPLTGPRFPFFFPPSPRMHAKPPRQPITLPGSAPPPAPSLSDAESKVAEIVKEYAFKRLHKEIPYSLTYAVSLGQGGRVADVALTCDTRSQARIVESSLEAVRGRINFQTEKLGLRLGEIRCGARKGGKR